MGYFSVKVVYKNGKPARDIGVMIDYGWLGGLHEKRTHSDGWVEFHNLHNKTGKIYVHGDYRGNHSLADGKTYSSTI